MAIEKYIIDKSELNALLIGEDLAIQPKGNTKGFCVEITGNLTNGDMIKTMFPNGKVIETENGNLGYEIYIDKDYSFCSWFDGLWWNAPYKAESEE